MNLKIISRMQKPAFSLLPIKVLFLFSVCLSSVFAQDKGRLVLVEGREGSKISYFWMTNPNAKATVLLIPGGQGGMGYKDGQPGSGNFLVRSRQHFIDNDLNVAILGNPSDKPRLDHVWRVDPRHAQDVLAVAKSIKAASPLPLWIVGTSNGTISAAALGIAIPEQFQGLVFTSSVMSWRIREAVPRQNVELIRLPVLFYHHEGDKCASTLAEELEGTIARFKNAEVKKAMVVSGGEGAEGDPCEAFHYHGFIGMEKQAVNDISSWIKNPQP
jgi:hypothetical protein